MAEKSLWQRCREAFVLGIVGATGAGLVGLIGWSLLEIHILKSDVQIKYVKDTAELRNLFNTISSDSKHLIDKVNGQAEGFEIMEKNFTALSNHLAIVEERLKIDPHPREEMPPVNTEPQPIPAIAVEEFQEAPVQMQQQQQVQQMLPTQSKTKLKYFKRYGDFFKEKIQQKLE